MQNLGEARLTISLMEEIEMRERKSAALGSGARLKPRLLVVGDAVAPTGFATVTRNLCRHLRKSFEIVQLGVNYFGDPHREGWKIYPACTGGDPQGVRRLKPLIESLRPDLLLAVNDPWFLGDYLGELRDVSCRPGIAVYCPVDAAPLEPHLIERLEGVDRCVTYTQFGRRAIESSLREVRQLRAGFRFPAIDVLPHGVDHRIFRPLRAASPAARRQLALRQLFADRPQLWNSFIVLNANRNQPRKRIDLTLKGFALFAKNKPGHVKLHLHMGLEDCGWNVKCLADRYGIQDRLILSTDHNVMPSVPGSVLNTIYNAAAIGVNTSIGEGWGLVSFEHAATGAAQVLPRHSACEELWDGSAALVDPVMSLTMEGVLAEAKIVSAEGVADALERMYESSALLEELSTAAYRNALRPEYRWEEIGARWNRLFWQMLESSPAEEQGEVVQAA